MLTALLLCLLLETPQDLRFSEIVEDWVVDAAPRPRMLRHVLSDKEAALVKRLGCPTQECRDDALQQIKALHSMRVACVAARHTDPEVRFRGEAVKNALYACQECGGTRDCKTCSGTGLEKGHEAKGMPAVWLPGRVKLVVPPLGRLTVVEVKTCGECHGSGTCGTCNGVGDVRYVKVWNADENCDQLQPADLFKVFERPEPRPDEQEGQPPGIDERDDSA